MKSRLVKGIVCALLLVSIWKPILPVWAGAVLVAFVALQARRDLRSPYARERWTAFKSLAKMTAFGVVLIVAGAGIGASLPSSVDSSNTARHAMAVLALYSAALVCVPMLIHAHLTRSRAVVKRRVRVSGSVHTLSRMAAEGGRRMTRVAV